MHIIISIELKKKYKIKVKSKIASHRLIMVGGSQMNLLGSYKDDIKPFND